MDTEFLTVEEVAEYLRLPLSTVYKLAQDKKLPGFKVGKHWRFRKEAFQEWIKLQEGKYHPPLMNDKSTVTYTGAYWADNCCTVYSSKLQELLTQKDILVVIRNGQPPFEVVLGVPHHAAIGEPKIAENWVNPRGGKGRDSDENAASFALVTFSKLCEHNIPCKVVIAAHATDHDPNKNTDSPYCREVFSDAAKLLFEYHGAGNKREQDIEISAGTNSLTSALEFGRNLSSKIKYQYSLSAQIQAGSDKAKCISGEKVIDTSLVLPALETTSLTQAGKLGIAALHLEAKPRFRIPDNDHSVSEDGLVLGTAIAEVIISRANL